MNFGILTKYLGKWFIKPIIILFYFMTHIDFNPFYPWPRPKNDFLMIWEMRYQFRHVGKGQMACAFEFKPYFYNNEDPWNKNWQFKYWNWPCCNQNSKVKCATKLWVLAYAHSIFLILLIIHSYPIFLLLLSISSYPIFLLLLSVQSYPIILLLLS